MEKCPFTNELCNKFKNVLITLNLNGVLKKSSCCQECFSSHICNVPIPQLASNLLENFNKLETMERNVKIRCVCGLSSSEIQSSGKFGCEKCYETFHDQIEQLLPRIQEGAISHVGKSPEQNDVQILKKEMEQAIQEERYEDAIRLRDRIKKLKETV